MPQPRRQISRPASRRGPAAARWRARGLTLPELLLSVAGIAMVGLAISAMLYATAYGTESTRDIRGLVVKNKALSARLNAAVRGSTQLLDVDANHIVLWINDDDGDGQPNVGEIRRIERNNGNQFVSYTANWTGMTAEQITAANVSYDPASDFGVITQNLKAFSYFPANIWANDLTNWAIALDDADLTVARVVGYRLTFTNGLVSDTAVGAASLRN